MLFHIFICHYTPLVERKKHIEKEFSKLKNIVVHFITEYDKENIESEICSQYFINSIDEQLLRTIFYSHNKQCPRFHSKPLSPAEMSLSLKHYTACKQIIEQKLSYALIIEDDAVFSYDFMNKMQEMIEALPLEWDVYFPNSTHTMFQMDSIHIEENNFISKRAHPATAYTISYLIKKSTCEKVVSEIEKNKIALPIDHELNHIFYKHNCNVYFNKTSPLITCANFPSSVQKQ